MGFEVMDADSDRIVVGEALSNTAENLELFSQFCGIQGTC